MSAPVVVSRIQNRRGTQIQFDGYVYNPVGPNSLYPHGYNGAAGYNNFPNFTPINYPKVLLPGELALCVDTGRIFIGNTDGRFIETDTIPVDSNQHLRPIEWPLPVPDFPGVFQPVKRTVDSVDITLEYAATPFLNILYDVTDVTAPDWNSVGSAFSRNGELRITAVQSSATPPPPFSTLPNLPPFSPATLVDTGTQINLDETKDVNFIAKYVGANIEIWYTHNFSTTLTLSTNTISWLPF
jgi:hypothetical protein